VEFDGLDQEGEAMGVYVGGGLLTVILVILLILILL
jgi:hypothetical protein